MVRTSAPSWLIANARHELIRRPSTMTVQAPHCPRSHPFLVPVRSRRSRKRSSSVTRGSESSTSRRTPFTVRPMERFMQGSDQCYESKSIRCRRRRSAGMVRLDAYLHIRRHPPLFKGGTQPHLDLEKCRGLFEKGYARTKR